MLESGLLNIPAIPQDKGSRVDHPYRLFHESGGKDSAKVFVQDDTVATESEAIYYCLICRHLIATAAQITEVNGHHRHVYSNPVGNVFEIGCFNNASGCISQGIPTIECTWFAGFSWSFTLCGQCHTHLGWKYTSHNHGSFFGLILNMLICH
jgi:hypothetical protein